jgi:hypothetical protein
VIVDAIFGVGTLAAFRRSRRRFSARRAAIVSPAEAVVGGDARVRGRLVADGLVEAPLTQRRCAFWAARIAELAFVATANGDSVRHWQTAYEGTSTAPFWLVGDDGARILVAPTEERGAVDLTAELEDVGEHPRVNDDNPRFGAFLRGRGVSPTAFMGIAGDARFAELVLNEGHAVEVYGAVDEIAVVERGGYRDGATSVRRVVGTADAPILLRA